MAVTISKSSPLSAEGLALIDASEAALREVYSPEECFSFSPEELAGPETDFLIAWKDGRAVGCAALVDQGAYGEIKRMYLDRALRGSGIATAMMEELETHARSRGLPAIKLETGPELAAAVRLYRRFGFTECGPFGGYPDIPSNSFMEKSLAPQK